MIQLLLTIVVIVVLCAFAVWVLGQLAPNRPPIVDGIIWVMCVGLVLLVLATAFGLADLRIPRIR